MTTTTRDSAARPSDLGRPARDLTDEELEQQGKNAHDTRNWVFLHGTAEQFARHTARMPELEQEYLRRYPKRTWQGSGGAATDETQVEILRKALRAILVQLEALLEPPAVSHDGADASGDPAIALLRRIAAAEGGRLNKLEVHQAAREVGLDRTALARLYNADPPRCSPPTSTIASLLTPAGRWCDERAALNLCCRRRRPDGCRHCPRTSAGREPCHRQGA